MLIQNTFKAISVCLLSLTLISCGSDRPMVNDVEVETIVDGNDIIMSLSADLGIGNLQLPNATIPIFIPKDGREIGSVNLASTLDGKNILSVDLNVTQAANLELMNARLPNGSMIPLIADTPVLVIPVDNVIVYLSLIDGAQALGVAVPIRSFDNLGSKVGTSALMPVFSKGGVLGAAGLFTSRTSGENGIALVADISGQLDSLDTKSIASFVAPQMQQEEVSFVSNTPSRRQKRRIDRELYKLHRKSKTLSLH